MAENMRVDLFGRVLIVEATKEEWKQIENQLQNLKLYKAEYDKKSDKVELIEKQALIEAHIEDDNIYAIAYPVIWRHIEPYVTEMGDKLREVLEAMRPIKVADHGYTLRDYQKEAVAQWLEKKAGIIALPTGAGKTVVAMEIIKRVARRTLVLVPTRVLADQWEERLSKFVNIGKYPRGRECDVVIATYQSFKHTTEFRDFYLVIADEGHHLPAEKWWKIALYNLFPARLVLSATPYRSDMNHLLLKWWCLDNVYTKTYTELMEKGYLAPLEINVIWVEPYHEEKLLQLEQFYKSLRGIDNRTAKIKMSMKRLLAEDPAKIEAVKYLVRRHKDEKIIIFLPYIETAKKVYNALAEYNPAILVGTGREAEFPRALTVEDFRRGATKVLIATQAGEEGVDIPDASVLINLDAPGERQLIQRIGRVARPKNKAYVYFIFAKGAMLDRRAWTRVKQILTKMELPKPKHFMYTPNDEQLVKPNFS